MNNYLKIPRSRHLYLFVILAAILSRGLLDPPRQEGDEL